MTRYWFPDPASSDPWAALERLRRGLDELTGRWGETSGGRSTAYPPVNLYETADAYVLTAELPGLRSDEIEITVEANRLTLRGERKIEYPKDASLHRVERQAGFFRRAVVLPVEVEAGEAEAIHRHGVLMLRLPKAPQHQPRRISVKAK